MRKMSVANKNLDLKLIGLSFYPLNKSLRCVVIHDLILKWKNAPNHTPRLNPNIVSSRLHTPRYIREYYYTMDMPKKIRAKIPAAIFIRFAFFTSSS